MVIQMEICRAFYEFVRSYCEKETEKRYITSIHAAQSRRQNSSRWLWGQSLIGV